METIIIQKLKRAVASEIELAEKYYAFLSSLNGLNLAPREIQLVAFAAIKGNISNNNVREEFIKTYDSSEATITNIICRLKKIKVIVKEGGKNKVNPQIVVDFKKDIILQITLSHEEQV